MLFRVSMLLSLLIVACGDGDVETSMPTPTPTPTRVTVTFEYRASTRVDPAVAAAAPGCVNGVGQTHIHPSWRSFALVNLTAAGDTLWTGTFSDVPVGRNSVRISDPNECGKNRTAAVTALAVFANGTLLTEIVDTPGSGIEPGFAFSVDASGRVTP
jgi:hypothetical protein